MVYLAMRYDPERRWLPNDPRAAAEVQRWFSVAAGQLRYGAAMARLICLRGAPFDLAAAQALAVQLLTVMNEHLARQPFLVGETPTLADIAIYTYTALAPEGRLSLDPYEQVRAWLGRIETLPGFVPMLRSPLPA